MSKKDYRRSQAIAIKLFNDKFMKQKMINIAKKKYYGRNYNEFCHKMRKKRL